MENDSATASRACELLEAFEQLEEEKEIRPGIVTYFLACNIITKDPNSVDLADVSLERCAKRCLGERDWLHLE